MENNCLASIKINWKYTRKSKILILVHYAIESTRFVDAVFSMKYNFFFKSRLIRSIFYVLFQVCIILLTAYSSSQFMKYLNTFLCTCLYLPTDIIILLGLKPFTCVDSFYLNSFGQKFYRTILSANKLFLGWSP